MFAPLNSLPVPADSNCTGALCLAVCPAHGSRDENSDGTRAGSSESHVCAEATSTAGRIGPVTQTNGPVPEPTGPWSKTF